MGFKPVDTMTPIGEEQPSAVSTNATQCTSQLNFPCHGLRPEANGPAAFGAFNVNINGFDWLSQQNGGQFDPQLFGSFREPQESILANATFDDSFFNDAFDMDFTTPYNVAPSPLVPKRDILAEIDAQKEDEDYPPPEIKEKYLTCNKIWFVSPQRHATPRRSREMITNPCRREKLQSCPKVQNGDFDLDGLCSELQKKAKCSGSGAVVDEAEFKLVMKKYLGKDEKDVSECLAP